MVKEFFENEGIHFFGELKKEDLLVIQEAKWKRLEEKIGGVESAVVFLMPYFSGQKTTNLSIYAQARDYHLYAAQLSEKFDLFCKDKGYDLRFLLMADTSPINERDAALKSGLGVRGKNGLLIHPQYGSFVFIGVLFLSKAISPQKVQKEKDCIGCGACLRACPTGALCGKGPCLSDLTQKKNRTDAEDALVKKALCKWGCDICQSVCPMNRVVKKTPLAFFREKLISELTPEAIALPQEEFSQRAFAWRGRELLKKNLQ